MANHAHPRRKNYEVWAGNVAGLLFFLVAIPCTGQTPGTTVSGLITSVAGTPVANAAIAIKNLTANQTINLTSNVDGSYALQNLALGRYEITASAPGYAPAVITVTLTAGSSPPANLVLQPLPGGAAKTSASSAVSGVVDSNSVSNLPLNGRSASDLAALEPGVSSARTQQTGQAQRGFGNQMTISGGRPRQNDARLDGISVNDYVNGPPGSALGVNLGSDAVEQFSVLTSNYPAQFGRSSGGIIGASTRSGTSDFHGDAFEYIRNSALDARNSAATNSADPPEDQYGRNERSFSATTKACGNPKALRRSPPFPQQQPAPATFPLVKLRRIRTSRVS